MNLAHSIDPHPDESVALISRGQPTTYGELRSQVASARGGLARLGVGRGDRVALLCGNSTYFVIAYLATLGLGAVAVPLNPTSPAPELDRELAAVQPVAAVLEPMAVAAWANVQTPVAHVVTADGSSVPGAMSFDELLVGDSVPTIEMGADDLAVLIFTSGTAGASKAAMLSHGNLLANLAQLDTARVRYGAGDVVYGVLPLHHIFGLNVVLGFSLAVGAAVVLVQRFDPLTAAETIVERNVTVIPGAPPLWLSWAHFPELPSSTFDNVRIGFTGAAKMPEEAMRRLHLRYGLTLSEGYGLTEASPAVTSSTGLPPRFGSVGKVLDGIEVRLVDEGGIDVLDGDEGEIWVKGPNVFLGYLDDPEATARALTADGWLRTGDIAVTDEDGYLYLVDRAKDLIIVSGFNVYPAEVEEVLARHQGVAEVAVLGVPHPHTGEAVKAFVVAEDGVHLDEEQLIDFCLDHLARYKCPNKVLFVGELPKGLGGKVLRRSLA